LQLNISDDKRYKNKVHKICAKPFAAATTDNIMYQQYNEYFSMPMPLYCNIRGYKSTPIVETLNLRSGEERIKQK